jgi:hypothetical protein
MPHSVLEVFVSDMAKYQAEILKALKPKVKPLLEERERLAQRLAGLQAQEAELKEQHAQIDQEIDIFKGVQVEKGLAGDKLHRAEAVELSKLRDKHELITHLLDRIKIEKAETVQAGIAIQRAIRDAWHKAYMEFHAMYQGKFDNLHRELSIFHVSYVRGSKAAFDAIMAGYKKEFPIESSPFKGYIPFALPWTANNTSIYKPHLTVEGLTGLG